MNERKTKENKYICVNITLPPDVYMWLSEKDNISGFIADVIRPYIAASKVICRSCGASYGYLAWEKLGKSCPECEQIAKAKEEARRKAHEDLQKQCNPTKSQEEEIKLLEKLERGVEQ